MEPIAGADRLDPDLQVQLRDFLMALADTKRALGLRYAEWCDRAPRLEAGVAASAMAQDQLGQARVLYAVIQQFPGAPSDLDDETRQHTASMACLDLPFPTWAAFVTGNLLIGSSVTVAEEALAGSRFTPLRSRMPKMLEEERFHRVHAEGWFKHLQSLSGEIRLEQARAIEDFLPDALCWFGDAQHVRLTEVEILTAHPADLRERYMERVGPLIEDTLAGRLVRFDDQARCWSYAGALPWPAYDPVTRRVGMVSEI